MTDKKNNTSFVSAYRGWTCRILYKL